MIFFGPLRSANYLSVAGYVALYEIDIYLGPSSKSNFFCERKISILMKPSCPLLYSQKKFFVTL